MILKMTNKDEDFYNYMGRFFGSRIVQTATKDRIYDDNNKTWYIYLNPSSKPCAFISVSENVIKNIYSNNDEYLKTLLLAVKQDTQIEDSIVTKIYENIYLSCGLKVTALDNYRHFLMIRSDD